MAILAMSRRAILALPWLGKPTGKMPVVLMGRMPMLRFHARANMTASADPDASVARSWSWSLTPTGNWSAHKQDNNGDGDPNDAGDVNQTRTHDKANQILTISGLTFISWGHHID